MLIWVLQSSQCSKMRVAQHWGRRGAHLSEKKGEKSACKTFSKKFRKNVRFMFQRFVTSIVDALVQSNRRLVEAKDI